MTHCISHNAPVLAPALGWGLLMVWGPRLWARAVSKMSGRRVVYTMDRAVGLWSVYSLYIFHHVAVTRRLHPIL